MKNEIKDLTELCLNLTTAIAKLSKLIHENEPVKQEFEYLFDFESQFPKTYHLIDNDSVFNSYATIYPYMAEIIDYFDNKHIYFECYIDIDYKNYFTRFISKEKNSDYYSNVSRSKAFLDALYGLLTWYEKTL